MINKYCKEILATEKWAVDDDVVRCKKYDDEK